MDVASVYYAAVNAGGWRARECQAGKAVLGECQAGKAVLAPVNC